MEVLRRLKNEVEANGYNFNPDHVQHEKVFDQIENKEISRMTYLVENKKKRMGVDMFVVTYIDV